MLKNSFATFLLALCLMAGPLSMAAQNNAIEKFFNQYMDDEAFTVVHVTPKMFQMIAKLDIKDKDYNDAKAVLQDLKGLWILTTEKNAKAPQLYKEAASKINTQEYELLMTVRDKGDNVRFWTKESNGIINELLMLVGEDAKNGLKNDQNPVSGMPESAPRASGTLDAHYAPVARLRMMDENALQTALDVLGHEAAHIAVYSRAVLRSPSEKLIRRRMPDDAVAAAQQLFAALRDFDAQGVRLIWVQTPPAHSDWDGVRDRLQRAAAAD